MRISTTPFLLTCIVFLCSITQALAAPPTFTIENIKHACGGEANGSFQVRVTASSPAFLRIRVFGGSTDLDQTFTPTPGLPFTFDVTGLTGAEFGEGYLVVVRDNTAGFNSTTVSVFDFTAKLDLAGTHDNNSVNCAAPNGAIAVDLQGSSPAGAVTYAWTGTGGPYTTQDLSNLSGGNYTLLYTDNNPLGATSCILGPTLIKDPAPTPYTISTAIPTVCQLSGFAVDISPTADTGWLYEVMEGATVLASAPGAGSALSINVPALSAGPHTLRVRASQGACPPAFNAAPDISININPAPDYNSHNGTICSDVALGFDLTTLKKAASVPSSSFVIVDPINADPGLVMVTGSPTNTSVTATELMNDVWTNTTGGPLDVTYTIGTFAGACPGNVITVKFTINPEPRAPTPLAKTICSGNGVAFNLQTSAINLGNSIASTTFVWQAAAHANVTGESTTSQAGAVIGDVLVNTTAANQVVVYTVTPTSPSGCVGDPFIVNVTVNPQPVAPNNIPKTICSSVSANVNLQTDAIDLGNAIPGTTFSWTAADNTNVTGEAVGAQATAIIGDVLVNKSSASQVVVYTVTPATPGGCVGNPFTVTITVNPEPVAPVNTPKTICSKASVAFNLQTGAIDLGNAIAGTTFSWTVADNANVTGESAGTQTTSSISDVLVNVTAAAEVVVYTVTPTSPAGCAGAPFTISVTVNPEPVGADAPKTICSGLGVAFNLQVDDINALGNSLPGTTFSWIATDNVNVTGESVGTQTTATIADVLVNTTSSNQVVQYTVTPTSAAGCVGASFKVNVTVNLEPVAPTNIPKTICSNNSVNVNLQTDAINLGNAIPLTTFSWTAADNASVTGESVGAQTTTVIGDVLVNTSASSQVVVYTVIPTSPGGCVGASFTVTMTVDPQPVAPANTPKTICSKANVAFNLQTDAIALGNGLVGTTFSWTVADNANVTGESVGTQTTSTIGDILVNVTAAAEIVTYTVIPKSAAGCAGNPFTVAVTVNPEPVGADAPKIICSGDAVAFDLQVDDINALGNSLAGTTFSWIATDNTNVTGESVGAQTSGSIADVLVNTTGINQIVQYTVTPTSANGCQGVSFKVNVTVNLEPVAPANIPKTICSNVNVNVNLQTDAIDLGNAIPATTFSWTVADNASVTGESVGAQTTTVIGDVLVNASSSSQLVVYTVTPTSPGGCAGNPFTITVTVNPEPAAPANLPKTICSNDNVNVNLQTDAINLGNGIAGTTFSWTVADNTNVTGESVGAQTTSTISDVLVNVSPAAEIVIYSVIPTSAAGCAGAQFTITVTVNPEPLVPGAPGTSCSGSPVGFNLQNAVGGGGNMLTGVTFVWKANADNPNVTGESLTDQTAGIINDVLVNATTATETVVYTVTPSSALGCDGAPFLVTITVVPLPVLVVGQTKEICGGTSVSYEILTNPANLPAGTSFFWNDPDGPFLPASAADVPAGSAGTIHINDVLINLSAVPLNVTYAVTPHIGTCNGITQNVVITVYRPAVVEAGNDQTICIDNGPYQLVGSFRALSATTATWSVVSEPTPGHAAINQPSFTNPSTSTLTASVPGDYVLKLESNDPPAPNVCGPAIDFVTVTVLDKPVITPLQTTLVCANDPVDYEIQMTPANTPANTVFNWTAPANPGATDGVNVPIGPPGTFHITDQLSNNSSANIDVTYTVTPSVGLCIGAPENILVTVKPGPVLALNQTKTICSGDQVNHEILLNPANTPAGTTLSWPDPDGSGTGRSKFNVAADPVGTFHITDTLYNGTAAPITVVYSVIAKGINGCNGVVRDVQVVVNPGAVVEAGSAQTVCSNGTATLIGSSIGGLATQGTWDIILNPSGGDGVITQIDPTAPATATFKATVAGNYTLRLTTDDPDGPGGCSGVSDIVVLTVKAPGDPSCTGGSGTCSTVSIVPVPTPATCSNSDGSVFFNINPSLPITGDVKITIDGTGSTVLPSPRTNFASVDGFKFDVLAVGTYSYVIEYGDASCTKTGTFSIDRSGTIGTATVTNLIHPTCFGGTGTATIDVPGETGNILQWTADGIDIHNFVVGNPVAGLPAGLIAIQRSGDPCAAGVFINFIVPEDTPLTFVGTDASCNGNDGTIEVVNYSSGEDPYIFEINGTQTNMPADSVFRGFAADSYVIAVTDNKGCTKTFAPIILRQIVGPGTLDTLYVKKAISVPDLPSGSALVGVNPSGLEPYETRLELTEPIFASQGYLSDWAEVPLNPLNLKFEQSYTNLYAGVYALGLRDAGGCTKNYVVVIDVDTQLFIPNIFTPNEDGHNDVFYIRNLPTNSKLLVTNRWGKEVYKTSAYGNDWNGGDTVDGVYYYTLTLGSQSYTGWIEILRGQ